MTRKKRWGKKFIDKRNWKEYNQKLVKRGEFYINPIFLDNWINEVHAKSFDFRSLEGIVRALSKRFNNFPVICFSQIRRRITRLPLEFKGKADDLIVGMDGSNEKVSNRGEWIRQQWHIRRGWIKYTTP